MNSERPDGAADHPATAEQRGIDGSSPAGSDALAGLPIEVADRLILRLNAIAYTLASSATLIDHQAAARIGQAIADLDRVIDDLRTTQAQPRPGRPAEAGAEE
jgi:hypothetical protein